MPSTKRETKNLGAATPRAWRNVTLSLGLVNVDVSLGSLMESHQPSGHVVCAEHKQRVTQPYRCDQCDGKPAETAKAFEHGGELVTLEDADIDACKTQPDNVVKLTGFVYAGEVDPIYFDKAYNIWPQRNMGGAYALLVSALRDSGRALVGTTTLTKSTRVMVIRWSTATETLVAHLCHYGANVKANDVALVQRITAEQDAPDQDALVLVDKLLESLASEFDANKVEDTYTEALCSAISAKATGTPVEHQGQPVEDDRATDLMDALRAEVERQQAAKAVAA